MTHDANSLTLSDLNSPGLALRDPASSHATPQENRMIALLDYFIVALMIAIVVTISFPVCRLLLQSRVTSISLPPSVTLPSHVPPVQHLETV